MLSLTESQHEAFGLEGNNLVAAVVRDTGLRQLQRPNEQYVAEVYAEIGDDEWLNKTSLYASP